MAEFVFPTATSIVILTGDGRFVRSDDLGQSWRELSRASDTAPEGGFASIQHLAVGKDGAIWGDWSGGMEGGDVTSSGVVVSRDGGQTFVVLDLMGCFDAPHPAIPVEVPNSDPLFGSWDALWRFTGDLTRCKSFMKAVSPPGRWPFYAVYCNGSLLAGESVLDQLTMKIYQSPDWGKTWNYQTQSFAWFVRFACGAEHDLWAVFDTTVAHLDEQTGQWTGVYPLETIMENPQSVSIAADGERLYVSGINSEGRSWIIPVPRYGEEGGISVLPLPSGFDDSNGSYCAIRVDHVGMLWASCNGLFWFEPERNAWHRSWPPPTQ